jgi:hypothetical protein
MEIIIKNKALTDVLEEIIQAYYDVCPTEAQIFEDMVRAESQHLVKQSGMSEDGCFMTLIKLPSNALYRFIKEQVAKRCGLDDFFRDPENYRLLGRVWANARIKKKPTTLVSANY